MVIDMGMQENAEMRQLSAAERFRMQLRDCWRTAADMSDAMAQNGRMVCERTCRAWRNGETDPRMGDTFLLQRMIEGVYRDRIERAQKQLGENG